MLGFLKRWSLLKEKSCLEEELFRGERLICLADDTESKQKDERMLEINKIIKHIKKVDKYWLANSLFNNYSPSLFILS